MFAEDNPPDIAHWTLSEGQVLTALQNDSQIPLPGSPLRELADRGPVPPSPPPTGNGFTAAWGRLIRPDFIVRLRTHPSPEPAQSTSHYAFAGDNRYVRYRRATSGSHHLEWPHTRDSLLAAMTYVLGSSGDLFEPADILTLDQDGYAAFLASVDCVYDAAAQAAEQGRGQMPLHLTAEVLLRSYQRSVGGARLFWLCGRGAQFAPGNSAPTLAGIERGMASLASRSLLIIDDGHYRPSEVLRRLSSRLSGEARFVSVTQKRRLYDESGRIAWAKRHLTAMRTLGDGASWLFAFEPDGDGFAVTIRAASATSAREWLFEALSPPQAGPSRPLPTLPPTAIVANPLPPALPEETRVQKAWRAAEWYVSAERGERTGMRFDVTDQLRIGRESDCHIRLSTSTVSRHHALLIVGSRGLIARDLGSTNGTFVNGVRIKVDAILRPGDIIDVGDTRLRVGGPDAARDGAPILAAAPPPAFAPPPAYIPPQRPAGVADPVHVAAPTASAAEPQAEAQALPPSAAQRRGWMVFLLIAVLFVGLALLGLAALFLSGVLTLPSI